jgi:hypothetical protein
MAWRWTVGVVGACVAALGCGSVVNEPDDAAAGAAASGAGGATSASSSSSDTGGSSSSTSAASSSSTGPGPTPCEGAPECEAEYSAVFYIGQVDHLTIRKANPLRDVCVQIYLTAPSEPPDGYDFTAPRPFAFSSAVISHAASDCEGMGGWSGEVEYAIGASGGVTWDAPSGYPCELDIDSELHFAAELPWVSAVEPMSAAAVPVEGCL